MRPSASDAGSRREKRAVAVGRKRPRETTRIGKLKDTCDWKLLSGQERAGALTPAGAAAAFLFRSISYMEFLMLVRVVAEVVPDFLKHTVKIR